MKMHYIATVLGNNEPQLQKNMCLSESAPPCSQEGLGASLLLCDLGRKCPCGGLGDKRI